MQALNELSCNSKTKHIRPVNQIPAGHIIFKYADIEIYYFLLNLRRTKNY